VRNGGLQKKSEIDFYGKLKLVYEYVFKPREFVLLVKQQQGFLSL